jgi:hypothetical protein
LVEVSRSATRGAPTRDTKAMKGATALAIASGFLSARCFGTSSPRTTDRYVIAPMTRP